MNNLGTNFYGRLTRGKTGKVLKIDESFGRTVEVEDSSILIPGIGITKVGLCRPFIMSS